MNRFIFFKKKTSWIHHRLILERESFFFLFVLVRSTSNSDYGAKAPALKFTKNQAGEIINRVLLLYQRRDSITLRPVAVALLHGGCRVILAGARSGCIAMRRHHCCPWQRLQPCKLEELGGAPKAENRRDQTDGGYTSFREKSFSRRVRNGGEALIRFGFGSRDEARN